VNEILVLPRTREGDKTAGSCKAIRNQVILLRAAARARGGHGRGIHGQSTARPVLYTAVGEISSAPTGRHGSRHGRSGHTAVFTSCMGSFRHESYLRFYITDVRSIIGLRLWYLNF
jgi:hypothetical protein